MAETKILGIVSIVPMGDWNADTEYQKLNFVRFNGATYLAKAPNINVAPGINAGWQDVWMLGNYDGGQQTVVPDGTYPEMTVGKVRYALMWGSKSYDGSSPQTITAEDLGIASVYKPQGSIEFAMLPAIPSQETEGYIWNITDNFTTDSRFLEGTGVSYSAGTNVGVIQNNGAYYYDVFGNFVDLSDYAKIYGTYPEMTVGNATNVTTQINGKFITDIFETDGTTVKTATNSPKSLYNLGAYDTYVDNGDGTVTVTRKTRYISTKELCGLSWRLNNVSAYPVFYSDGSSDCPISNSVSNSDTLSFSPNGWGVTNSFCTRCYQDGSVRVDIVLSANEAGWSVEDFLSWIGQNGLYIQAEVGTSEQYTEPIIAETPINTLDANMSDIVRDEVEKTLNLFNGSRSLADWGLRVGSAYTIYAVGNPVKISKIWNSGSSTDETMKDINNNPIDGPSTYTFVYNTNQEWSIFINPATNEGNENLADYQIMCCAGSHAYPYQPYNGAIVHEKELDDALEGYIQFIGTITDINNASIGEYRKPFYGFVNSNTGNAPTTSAGTLFTNNHSATYASQQYITDTGRFYIRDKQEGTWNAWKQIADQNWVQANYLPLTGGTIYGAQNLKIQVQDSSWQDGIVLMESPSGAAQIFFNQEGVSGQKGVKAYLGVADGEDPRAGTLFFSANRNTQPNGLVYIDGNNYLYELGQRVYSPNNEPPYPVTSRVRFMWMNTRGIAIGECVFTIGGKITSLTDLIDTLHAGGYRSARTYYPVFTMVCLDTTTSSVLQNSDFDTPVKGIYVYNYSSAIIGAVGVNGQALTSFNSGVTIDTSTFSVTQV